MSTTTELISVANDSFTLNIRTLYDKQIDIICCSGDTVEDVKKKIHDQEGIPVEMMEIKYENKSLSNKFIIDNGQMDENSELLLVLTMKGGTPMPMEVDCCDCCGSTYEAVDVVYQEELVERRGRVRYGSHNCCKDGCRTSPNCCSAVLLVLCFCLSWIWCLFSWFKEEKWRKENPPDFLNEDIINGWSEYERMLRNIHWDTEITQNIAKDINSTMTPQHYLLFTTIYDKTNNTPAKIRNKYDLFQYLDDEDLTELLWIVIIKCCKQEMKDWLNSLNLRVLTYPIIAMEGLFDLQMLRQIRDIEQLNEILFAWSQFQRDIDKIMVGITAMQANEDGNTESFINDYTIQQARGLAINIILIGVSFN